MAQAFWIRYQNGDNNNEKHKTAPEAQWDEIRTTAMRVTTLAYSQAEDADGLPKEEVYAKGDFWLDLDSGSLQQSIEDVRKIIDWLDHNHVDLSNLAIYASGSKGFHICMPAKLMGTKAEKVLWLVYRCFAKAMAEATGVYSIDYSLYDYKHLLRTEGKQRSDGRYKVPLTLTELHSLTPESYADLTSSPRPPMECNRKISVTSYVLGDMVAKARKEAAALVEAKKKSKAVPDAVLAQFNDNYHPRCVDWMVNQINLKSGVQFNELAMNVAAYVALAPISQAARQALIQELAGHRVAAVGGRPVSARIAYIWDKVKYADSGTIQFRCLANKNVIEGDPCEGCPVRTACLGETQEGIEAREDGYYSVRGETPRRLSNWVISGEDGSIQSFQVLDDSDPNSTAYKWDKADVLVLCEGKAMKVTVPPSAFDSSNAFKKEVVRQVPRGVWYGTDADTQSLKLMFTDPDKMQSIIKVKATGIHRHVDEGIDGWVYAEEGWSFHTSRATGTHVCQPDAKLRQYRHMRHQAFADPTDPRDVEAFELLLNSNQPQVVGTMLAWVAACHLKTHWRKAGVSGFPLLHPYGASSAGKTASSMLYAALGGSDYRDSAPPSVGEMTGWPLKIFCTATTTVPRILDEVNRQLMTTSRLKEAQATLRNCYGDGSIRIGALGKEHAGSDLGARTIELLSTTPTIFCATQQNTRAELKERSIEVHLPKYHSPEHTAAFERLRQHDVWERLFGYSKLLVFEALQVSLDEIKRWRMDAISELPTQFADRHKDNHAALLAGFRLLDSALRAAGFSLRIIERIAELRKLLVEYWFAHLDEYIARQAETEILKLFKQFAKIAAWVDKTGHKGLVNQIHYLMTDTTLYMDLNSCWMELEILYSRMGGRLLEYENTQQIKQLLADETWYIGSGPVPGHPQALDWIALDRVQLERQGVDVKAFAG